MLPVTSGIVPFGLVMGTVSAHSGLDFFQTVAMNLLIFAGASQLASIDLMTQKAPVFIVVLTGLIINLRFMLYSAALSTPLQKSGRLTKAFAAYSLSDQAYAVFVANKFRFKSLSESISFYIGASVTIVAVWQASVWVGFLFGNIAPPSLSLDYAVPLSFAALVIPTLKNHNYLYVAMASAVLSLAFRAAPLNLGLLISGLLAIALGAFLTRGKVSYD